uniref:Uncharacterized protein n=1 Tax=Rhizochromulina marina TaxID=1034831 RepID=A0A7S2SJC0_9STRA|mmetsp:Transcript_3017/g.8666  ORF Transcript_3017/g.8666 Transcript_3017/m.8666 type:complete len:509 (+) Transcript_3017:161-1687(+)
MGICPFAKFDDVEPLVNEATLGGVDGDYPSSPVPAKTPDGSEVSATGNPLTAGSQENPSEVVGEIAAANASAVPATLENPPPQEVQTGGSASDPAHVLAATAPAPAETAPQERASAPPSREESTSGPAAPEASLPHLGAMSAPHAGAGEAEAVDEEPGQGQDEGPSQVEAPEKEQAPEAATSSDPSSGRGRDPAPRSGLGALEEHEASVLNQLKNPRQRSISSPVVSRDHVYLSAAEGVTATSAREGLLALDSEFDVSALQDALKQAKAEGMDIESILKDAGVEDMNAALQSLESYESDGDEQYEYEEARGSGEGADAQDGNPANDEGIHRRLSDSAGGVPQRPMASTSLVDKTSPSKFLVRRAGHVKAKHSQVKRRGVWWLEGNDRAHRILQQIQQQRHSQTSLDGSDGGLSPQDPGSDVRTGRLLSPSLGVGDGAQPCGDFKVDILASDFGVCRCGFKKFDHAQFGGQRDRTSTISEEVISSSKGVAAKKFLGGGGSNLRAREGSA